LNLQTENLKRQSNIDIAETQTTLGPRHNNDKKKIKKYNTMKTIQSISQKTKEWATTKSRETTM
jgi:hypothetical protein